MFLYHKTSSQVVNIIGCVRNELAPGIDHCFRISTYSKAATLMLSFLPPNRDLRTVEFPSVDFSWLLISFSTIQLEDRHFLAVLKLDRQLQCYTF